MFESLRRSGWTGLAVVVGAVTVLPAVAPGVARAARPLMKSGLKAGLTLAEQARERLAELGEAGEDLLAEVRNEMAAEQKRREAEQEAAEAATTTDGDEPEETGGPQPNAA